MGLKARVLCKRSSVALVQGAIASQSCLSRCRDGPSIIRTDALHCTLTSWVFWSISADVTRGARGPSADTFTVLEGKQCTRWQTAGRPEQHTNAGHRDETYGVAEISSTSAPAPWPNFSEKLDEVGHQSRSALTFRSTPADPPGQV